MVIIACSLAQQLLWIFGPFKAIEEKQTLVHIKRPEQDRRRGQLNSL